MSSSTKILYVDAILAPDSARCLFEGTQSGLQKLPAFKNLKLERVLIQPRGGKNPREFFNALATESLEGLVLSGSEKSVTRATSDPWVADYLAGLEYFLSQWKIMPRPYPILGICFAHQAISKVLGGEVGASGSLKVGPVRVDAVQKRALPHHFSESDFLSWNKFVAYHEDQVQRPPSEMLPIFASDYCAYQGFLHPTLPLWTVQFHPEMNENILEVASEKDLWAPFGRDDLSDQKGNELLEFFAAWVLKNKK